MRTRTLLFSALCLHCTRGSGDDPPECALNGELIITEVFANPRGRDEGHEWIEIANGALVASELAGVELRADDDIFLLPSGSLSPGAFGIIGGSDVSLPGTWNVDDLSLTNSGGSLSLSCAGHAIDEVSYGTSREGVAIGFDGSKALDGHANDQIENWCEQISILDGVGKATPLAANDFCPGASVCRMPDGLVRPRNVPQPGDVWISEVMANSQAVADGQGEWFEIALNRDLDLNGLWVGKPGANQARALFDSSQCLVAKAGDHVLFARNADMALNGGLPLVGFIYDFGLKNTNDGLVVGVGDVTLDTVTWSKSASGRSRELHPAHASADDNDNERYWCVANHAYGAGDRGTPGAANHTCELPLAPGYCYESGVARAISLPASGQLLINEVFADPTQVSDAAGEWIELAATATFDLNGLEIGRASPAGGIENIKQVLHATQCRRIHAGDLVVLAAAESGNGGIPVVDGPLDVALAQSAQHGIYLSHSDRAVVLDVVTWTTQLPSGRSLQRHPTDATYCHAPDLAVYGAGDHGTPGLANACE